MADDNRAQIVLDGDVSPLKQKFREAAEDLKRFGAEGSSALERMTGPLGRLQEKFVAVAAILGGGAVFKEAVNQTALFTEESIKLGDALDMSATGASTLIAALEDIDVSQADFAAAAKGMAKELRTNESALQSMGIKTRDAAGNLRPLNELVIDGIEAVKGYRSGTDRAIAGQVAFGKGFQLTGNLLKLNNDVLAENAELQQRLGAQVGAENVAAWQAYDAAGDKAHLTIKALNTTLGNALLPVLTDLGNWFVSIGPAAVTVIRGAVGGLAATFHFLTMGVTVLWETLNAMVVTVAEPLRALGASIGKALTGDFAGAKSELTNIPNVISGAWGQAFDEMAAKAQSTRERVWNLFAEGTPAAAPATGGRSADHLVEKPKAESRMDIFERQLAAEKELASQRNALREFTKAQELAFWEQILAHETMTQKDRIGIEKKISLLRVDVRREEAKKLKALDDEGMRAGEERALAKVEAEQAASEAMLAGGEITQQQALKLEEMFEARRFEIKRAYAEARKAQLAEDPDHNPVEMAKIKNKLLELEQQYLVKRNQMQGKQLQLEKVELDKKLDTWRSLGQSMSSLWDKGVNAMMNGTLKWRNATKAIGMELAGWFARNVVGKMLSSWLAGKAAQFAISMGWMTKEQAAKLGMMQVEQAAEEASADHGMMVTAQEATAKVGNHGASAAAGAADSVASIPYIGPILAAAAFAATLGMVLGARSNIKSASRGFDIPRGLNPMTQLHEEEMVLPAEHANTIRSLRDRADGSSSGSTNIVINALDARSVKDYFKANAHALGPALRRLGRNASPTRA